MTPKGKITKMSNDTLGITAIRIMNYIDASSVEEVKSADFYKQFATDCTHYTEATKRSEKKKTDAINIEFQKRNELFTEIWKYSNGLQISPDDEMKASAIKVHAVVNLYGRFFGNLKVSEQSYNFNRIISGLKKPELTADLLSLKLTAKVAQLEAAHQQYEELYMQWGNIKKSAISASQMRSNLVSSLKNMLDELDWMLRKTPSEGLKNLHTNTYTRIAEVTLSNAKSKPDETADTTAPNATNNEKAA